jgi:large subunit ribosomal protein L18
MEALKKKIQRRSRIKLGIRKKISGTPETPRLSVFRSNSEIYAQLIDDIKGSTLVAASSLQKGFDKKGKTKIEVAKLVGKILAEEATKNNITSVVFDRNGYLYHGRVKSLAEGAREGGLIF